ncbi:MAG: STN domain-containing protein [Planctomycetota bacterium]|nr:STN domain-containing protein [Planctomycetota bacterium]
MNSSRLTLLTLNSLRNQLIRQEYKLAKADCSHLTLNRSVTLALFAWLVLSSMPMQAFSQNESSHPCLSASAIPIQQVLQAPCEQSFESQSLELMLDNIGAAYSVPIWCDRRIARDTAISMDRRDETLESFLSRAIDKVDAVLIPIDGVIMVVPSAKRDEIDANYWRLSVSPAAKKMRPTGAKPFGWSDGSVALNIIQDFSVRCAPDANLEFKIEHDIWRKFEFRKTSSPASISVCLLSGFDLGLADQKGVLVVAPIEPVDSSVVWTYSNEEIEKKIGPMAWKEWRAQWPSASISKSAKPAGWRVTATVAGHRDLIRPLIPKKKWEQPKLEQKGFTGPMEGELEYVIRSLAVNAKLEFFPLPLPADQKSIQVKLILKNTPIDEILKEITKQSGVQFKRQGNRVEVLP